MIVLTISLRLPDIAEVPGPLYFADTHEKFENQLDVILRSDFAALRQQVRDTARKNSWAEKADDLMCFVGDL